MINENHSDFHDHFTTSEEVKRFASSMQYLSERIPVWPPNHELLRSSFKYNIIQDLDTIAETVTNTARPTTTLLSE